MNKIFKIAVMLLVGGALGYLFGKYGLSSVPKDLPKIYVFSLLVFLIPIYFLVVGFHEIGHAVAGKSMGFDFRMFIIGPFFFEKENKKWKFKWNKSLNLSGGMVVCLPTSEANLRKRFINYVAGGPLASILLSLFIFTLWYFLPLNEQNNALRFFGIVLIITSFLSFLIFLVTAIPFKAGTFYSDGGRIKRLMKNDDTSEMEILFLKIMSKTNAGVRYADIDENDLERAYYLADKLNDPFKVYLISYLFHAAFDKNDLEKAEIYLNNYLDNITEIPEPFRGVAWLDASIFYGLARKDLSKTQEYWSNFKPSPFVPKAQIFLAEAVLANLNGDKTKVGELISKALQELPNLLDKGMAISIKERLESLKID
ncbi:MAG: M50 family metallopeptidase [Leadbetterella sp.]|nr:M50 family metallopeptidase [Leadbetterella sp.]